METWDFSALGRAVDRLEEGLARHHADPSDEQLRDGLVQRYEFTYELAVKTLRRYLANLASDPEEVKELPFSDLARRAQGQGLIREGWPRWGEYRRLRSKSPHAYDPDVASEIVAIVPDFLAETLFLWTEVTRRTS